MIMPSMLRRVLYWGGSGLALIGIVFVGFRLHTYWLELDFTLIPPRIWLFIAALALVYGSANFLLASAWWNLLEHLGAAATRLESIKIYGVSQLAKYAPGNIFHLAGRQALGMASGISGGILAKSTLWELGSIAVAGALFAWLVLPLLFPGFSVAGSAVLLLGSLSILGGLLYRFSGCRPARAFIWQFLFLSASGAAFAALLYLIAGGNGLETGQWLMIGSAYIVAWLAGLVTPGAPAGVGVREMILLLLLNGLTVEANLLLAVVLGRVVTVFGDLLFFAVTAAIPARLCR